MNNKEIHKVLIILRALMMGITLEHWGVKWRMDTNFMLCNLVYDEKGNEAGLMIYEFAPGIALGNFILWALEFTDEELEVIGANITLNEIRT